MPGVTRTLANTNVTGSVYGVDPTASNGVIDPLTGQAAAAPTAIDPLTGLPVVDPQATIDPLTGQPVTAPQATIDPLTGQAVTTNVYGTSPLNTLSTLAGPRTWESNTWDAANRLISNTNVSGDVTTYSYDGDNNRVGMSTRIGSGAVQDLYPSSNPAGMRDGWEPQYKKEQIDIYFANDTTMSLPEPLMATGANGKKWEQSYVYGAGGERISMSYLPSADANTDWEPTPGASGALPNTTPKTLNYLSDIRGSAIGLVGQDGSISARYHYDEFGVAKDAQKFDLNYPGPDNLFGYTGLGYDFNSGYTYARARYLDSSIGRFVSEDTYEGNLKNPLSLNLYTYVENNPLIYVDPTGHKVWLIHGTFSGGSTWTPDFGTYVKGLFNETTTKLNWSGENTKAARSNAAEEMLNKVYEWHKKNPDEPIRLVGHSHGGNVAILLANLLDEKGMKVDTLITIATPVREYKLETEVGQHIHMYNNRDSVQMDMGGYDFGWDDAWKLWELGLGSTTTRKFKNAENVRAKDAEKKGSKIDTHSAMHSNVDIWKKYIEPILKLGLHSSSSSSGSF